MSAIVTVTTELTQIQALALAQFVKRLTWLILTRHFRTAFVS